MKTFALATIILFSMASMASSLKAGHCQIEHFFCYCDTGTNNDGSYNLNRVDIISSNSADSSKFETVVDEFSDRPSCLSSIATHPSCK